MKKKELTLKTRPKWTQLGGASGKDFDAWFEGFEKQEQEKQKRDIDILYEKFKIAQKTMKPSALSDDFTGFIVGYMFRGKEILGK